MGNVRRRVERLEDRVMPKPEIPGPYPRKELREGWLAEFRQIVEEQYRQRPWSYVRFKAKNKAT